MSDSLQVKIEELKKEIQQLRIELDSLKALKGASQSDQDDAFDKVEERLEKRIRELENKVDAVSRSTAPTILNPRTTAFINFATRRDNQDVGDEHDLSSLINNRNYVRSAELEFRAPVDPYADAVMILSVENNSQGGFEIDAEEVYGLIKRLPILETAPLGLKLKLGKFRAPFGINNKIHMHDLPWTTRPLVVSKYLGTEHGDFFEGGYAATGVDLDFFVPNLFSGSTIEMNLDVLNAGEVGISTAEFQEKSRNGLLGHITFSKDWNNEHLLILGISGYNEKRDHFANIYGADFTYKWAPVERRESHSFLLGGEIIKGEFFPKDRSGNISSLSSRKNYGWFMFSQYQFSYWTYLGLRYDWVEEPYLFENGITRAGSVYLSYYTTEFLRFRIGFQHTASETLPSNLNNVNTFLFDANFVFGSHPTEPYWVNR